MAGGQDQPIAADVAQDREVLVVDHAGVDHAEAGRAVGQPHQDQVARVEVVEVAERRAPGGAVTGDRGGAAEAGQAGLGVVARAAAQPGRVGALDHGLGDADRRDLHPRDRVADLQLGEQRPRGRPGSARHADELARGGGGVQPLAQLGRQARLRAGLEVGGDRLLPGQHQRALDQQQDRDAEEDPREPAQPALAGAPGGRGRLGVGRRRRRRGRGVPRGHCPWAAARARSRSRCWKRTFLRAWRIRFWSCPLPWKRCSSSARRRLGMAAPGLLSANSSKSASRSQVV